jgi:hypothetical protein
VSNPISSPAFETETLERLKYAMQRTFSTEVVQALDVEWIQDDLTRSWIARVRGDILAKRLPDRGHTVAREFTYAVPASTWQMFKQRHAGAWWLRWLVDRRPAQELTVSRSAVLTVDISDYVAFPWQTAVNLGDTWGQAVRVPVITEDWTWMPAKEEK